MTGVQTCALPISFAEEKGGTLKNTNHWLVTKVELERRILKQNLNRKPLTERR